MSPRSPRKVPPVVAIDATALYVLSAPGVPQVMRANDVNTERRR